MSPGAELPSRTPWRPTLGAWPDPEGCTFSVWAPDSSEVHIAVEPPQGRTFTIPMSRTADGTFTVAIPRIRAGDRYRYYLPEKGAFPDPASRYQPEGVHGPSEVVDPSTFPWTDRDWNGIAL